MANQIAYSRKSIINLSGDSIKVSYGTVEKTGGELSLKGRARCGFEYTFKTGFWYPFDQNEYGVELHSGDECEVTESFSYEGAEEYFEKW